MAFSHELIVGNGDVVSILEDVLEQAKSGELVGVIVCGITDGGCGWTGAVRDGLAFPWPRLQAAIDTAQMEVCRDGIVGWK